MQFYTAETINRFEALIAYIPFHSCYEWLGPKNANGYGTFTIRDAGGQHLAHRVAYRIHNGAIPNELRVLHSCNNRACVRIEHLMADTQARNMYDASVQGRMYKLTKEQISEILKLYVPYKYGQMKLAKQFAVCENTIMAVLHRAGVRSWRQR